MSTTLLDSEVAELKELRALKKLVTKNNFVSEIIRSCDNLTRHIQDNADQPHDLSLRTVEELSDFLTAINQNCGRKPDAECTPGPWQSRDETYAPEEIFGNLDMDEGRVTGRLVCTLEYNEEFEANRRLIIAAPSFLTVSHHVIGEYDEICNGEELSGNVILRRMEDSIERLRKTVEKAELIPCPQRS